jgi:hypothetical protein
MRKFLLALPLLLAACAGGIFTADQISTLIQQIQADVAKACSFQPLADGVGALINAFFPAGAPFIQIEQTISDAICKAPVTSSVVRGGVVQDIRIVQTPKGPIALKGTSYR